MLEQRITEVENGLKLAGLATKSVLTVEEASAFTGLSKSYLYKLTSSMKIPHYKPTGKLCYFDRLELESWLKQNKIETTKNHESVEI